MALQKIYRKPLTIPRASGTLQTIKLDFRRNKLVYMLAIPVILYYILFCYVPMWGALIAFVDYKPIKGLTGSTFVGLKYFKEFITGPYFMRTVGNTFMLNLWGLVFGFPAPLILALMLNEVRHNKYKRLVQTVTYMPHFISLVVVAGLIHIFTSSHGLLTSIVSAFTGQQGALLGQANWFRPIYTFSGIWQDLGWNSIIYLAAMAGVSPELYESAQLDGAGKFKQMWHVTLPAITPTIIILFIFAIGGMMASGYEKVILLYNSLTYSKADVIASYVYRRGIQEFSYSFSTAVGLLNSFINFFFLWFANTISRKYSEISLW
jgi:putative aldouronate transport system permease protein